MSCFFRVSTLFKKIKSYTYLISALFEIFQRFSSPQKLNSTAQIHRWLEFLLVIQKHFSNSQQIFPFKMLVQEPMFLCMILPCLLQSFLSFVLYFILRYVLYIFLSLVKTGKREISFSFGSFYLDLFTVYDLTGCDCKLWYVQDLNF